MLLPVFSLDVPTSLKMNGGLEKDQEYYFPRRNELNPPDFSQDLEILNQVTLKDLREENSELKKIKYFLLNGETRLAKTYLSNIISSKTKIAPIAHRYLSILQFIDGEYENSYKTLSHLSLLNEPNYSKICVLKVLNQVVLNKLIELEDEWNKCQSQSYSTFNEKNFVWLDTIIQLKLKPRGKSIAPFRKVRLSSLDTEQLKIYLKMSLYLNQESLVSPDLLELNVDQLQDTEVRELIGQIYFRQSSFAKSYRFIEDLRSPNAETIKGNLYVLREKYELAYAQFKLALEQKSNSQNALERLLPLAWLLQDWKSGAKYAEQVFASPQTQINKLTLLAAFLTQGGEFKKASEILETLTNRSIKSSELDITQISSFVALMENKPREARKSASLSCDSNDFINCWILYQLEQWDGFPHVIKRDEEVVIKKKWESLIKEEVSTPLTETVYVNQLDIEELDDKLIQLNQK